jgi:hypothetical protein
MLDASRRVATITSCPPRNFDTHTNPVPHPSSPLVGRHSKDHRDNSCVILSGAAWGPTQGVSGAKDLLLFLVRVSSVLVTTCLAFETWESTTSFDFYRLVWRNEP